jgi:tRNA(Ile)-lysidine synthase
MNDEAVQLLIDNVRKCVKEHGMLDNVKKAIIAFSAGPDSVCLLDALQSLFGASIEFELVYVDHGLRSRRAIAREERMTKEYAARYRIRSEIIKIKVAKSKLGIEATARMARQRVLLKYAKRTRAQRIVLGHNLDDFVETFLLNIIRGSGMRGFRSIPAIRLPFVRPLINVKKQDILRYVQARKLPYAVDKSNLSPAYRRNLLRIKVMPILQNINPEIHEVVRRETEIIKQDDEYIWKQAEKAYPRVVCSEKDCVLLDLHKIVRYNHSLVSRIVMKAILDIAGSLDGFESKHYHAVVGLTNKESGKKITLPKGLYAQREHEKIVIGYRRLKKSIEIALRVNGHDFIVGEYKLNLRILKRWNVRKKPGDCEIFDLDKIVLPLYVRNRRDGDLIETKIGRKKLKKIFSEHRIASRVREKMMLLCDQKGILWLLGVTRAFRGFVGKGTKRCLAVSCERIDQRS